MQQSEHASWALPRPRRQVRQPTYLQDYEVSAVRPKSHTSRNFNLSLPVPSESVHSQQPHIQWRRPPETQAEYALDPENQYEDISRGWPLNPKPCTQVDIEQSELIRGSNANSYTSLYGQRREPMLSALNQAPVAEQCDPLFESWPVSSMPVAEAPLMPEEENEEVDTPPPPRPSSNYLPEPTVEEHRVFTAIDRMMSELQLMRDRMTPNRIAQTHPHSTHQSHNSPHHSRGLEHNTWCQTQQSGPNISSFGHPPSMHSTSRGPLPQPRVRPYMSQPQNARSREQSWVSTCQSGGEYRGPAPKIPQFIHNDPMEFSRFKLALTNLLPADAPELFKYQILVDHVKLEEACLIADSFINSPRPYTDTMNALTEKFGQPHHIALRRIAALMESPEIKRGDLMAFERFSLHVQSLVGMLQTLGPDGDVELSCGSHVARLLTKLPIEMRANFRRSRFHHPRHTPTLLDLAEWLRYESWCQGYDTTPEPRTSRVTGLRADKRFNKPVATVLHGSESSTSNRAQSESQSPSSSKQKSHIKPYCPYCNNTEHFLNKCQAIQKLTREQIVEWIKSHKRCWRCGRAHQASQCDLKRLCDICQKRHLRVLHDANTRPEESKAESCLVNTSLDVLYLDKPSSHARVLLKVVRVTLQNGDKTLDTYAILDDGSERTMLLPEAVNQLNLDKRPETLALRTIRQEVQTLNGASVSFKISSTSKPKKTFQIKNAFTSKRLGLADHSYPVASLKKRYKHLADLPLESFAFVKPLVLIGADYPQLISPVEPVRLGPPGGPAAIRTRLGWTLQGPAHLIQWAPTTQQCLHTSISSPTLELMQNVERLWKMDALPYQSTRLAVRSKEDKEALELLEVKTKRVQDAGIFRYATPLLRKQGVPPLRAQKESVLPSLRALERRLARDPQQAEEYCAAISKLEEAGAIRRLTTSEVLDSAESYYIPHHVVRHNGKSRIVFNCSFPYQGRSLNDTLLPGPTLGASLLGVLLRFREHAVAISSDIRGMFHQVQLLPEDQPLLRFIWRDMKRADPPAVFQWQVLPFGTACSPCCATFALHRHARDHSGVNNAVLHSVEHCFYVDNCLQSLPTAEEAKELVDQLRDVLASGGFELRQWASNVPDVLRHLPAEVRSDSMERWLSHDEPGLPEPALGLSWHWGSDTLGYRSRPVEYKTLTMRNIYKVLARQYDPLGFIAPYTTRAKLIVQSMWDKPRDWDDPCIPPDLQKAWTTWESELHWLPHIAVPRPYAPGLTEPMVVSRQIHVFSDASTKAYGSVAYIRTEDVQGRIQVAFLAARSRVAPRRQHSIPRLELCGALTAAQLAKKIETELTIKTDKPILWSDSTTVLTWLHSESCRFKVFVGTRIAEIQELTAGSTWLYVDTAQNPADDVTRGKALAELAVPNRWSQGPLFLHKPSTDWPSQPGELLEQDISEYKKVTLCGTISKANRQEAQGALTYQSWNDLMESVAQEAYGAANQDTCLTAEDYRRAEKSIFSRIQAECFPEELHCLKAGKAVPRSSRLASLSPELDPSEGFIRVGGRLRRAEGLDTAFKHPILLDPSHHMTKLLIRDYDERLCHPGPERVFAEIRRTFWILRGREAIRREQHQCQGCQRWKAKPSVPKMADLPLARLRLYQPAFYSTGVDCFGPFQVRIGRRSEKRWGIIYKCLTTRAVHLDLLHAMDSDSFLMSLRRFIARRGSPAELYSDQGTNFRGGEKELSEWFSRMSPDLQQLLAKQKIAFCFNPPAAPHFGGTWEREIKSVKMALNTVIGAQPISEEVLRTVLLEVEAILNSKPLGYTSSNVADLDAVTPSILLMGRLDGTLPPVVYPKSEGLSRRRWRHCQVLADHFWARFIRCYLPTLQCRQKWRDTQANLTNGAVVMLMDPQYPRALWPIGRVIKVHPSVDGCVRSVDVQVKDRVYTRPVARLILLPAIPAENVEEMA
ncbi:uncharacterized protein [Danio rerio]|uniref:Uncharacterized protein n=1 Tax=Danio rerio TaxID=7955 RepID=A0AC58HKL2_DANRE|nr:uncharacterized protein LOC103908963 [Danio rerio]|eukprot:XP_021322452.1 uncharacterized protein LOC103908963 [Danio rerio]